ncbi:MAG: P-loop NTPase, partial [Akkermansia sp.]
VLGLVENYSYFQCPDCGKQHEIFGKSHLEDVAKALNLPILARLPIDPKTAEACDGGAIEQVENEALKKLAETL